MKTNQVELLAPAGNMAALHAAVAGGADAVYLGLETFNARRGADNFTLETLREACDFAHLRGVSIYVTMNTIILPDEVGEALECVRQAYRAGADGFIVQDIGLAAEISRTLPEASLHLSTQMNTHNLAGVRAAARLGAERITLAREVSLDEIALARKHVDFPMSCRTRLCRRAFPRRAITCFRPRICARWIAWTTSWPPAWRRLKSRAA